MAFLDLLDLRTAVIEQVRRPDITDAFPRLVKLAESTMNRRLRLREMMAQSTLTIVSSEANLPADYVEAIGLYRSADGLEFVEQPVQPLQTVRVTGYYAVSGGKIRLDYGDGDYILSYYASIPTIADSLSSSNYVLQRYPALYLYQTSFEAAKHVRDVELASAMKSLADGEFTEAMGDDMSARYSRARVRVQGVTP